MIRQLLVLTVVFVTAVHSMGVPMNFGGECEPQCPEGFKKFTQRSNGAWCMKVIKGNMTWWEAERECRCSTRGAHLSGVENTDESRWVEDQGIQILDKIPATSGSIWIGAYRRKECPSGSTSSDAVCQPEKLFQFTDQHTCKTTIFQNWAENQPSNNAGDDCAAIIVSTEQANGDASGKPTAKNCLQTNGSPFPPVGYVCGVKPSVPTNNYGGGDDGYYGGGGYGGPYGGNGQVIVVGAGKPQKKH